MPRMRAAQVSKPGGPLELVEGSIPEPGQPAPRVGDITILGYFVSVNPGSIAKRMALGLGSGAAELSTVLEVYLMTDKGLRRLGSVELNSTGPKTPGEALPLAVTVATGNLHRAHREQRHEGRRRGQRHEHHRRVGLAHGQRHRRPAEGGGAATGVDLASTG